MRVQTILVFGLLGGCGGWPPEPSDDDSPAPPAAGPRDAGTDCTSLSVLLSEASPQVNGAFCFGVAAGASEYLACTATSQSVTQCEDQLLGSAYAVQWTAGRGSVVLAGSNAVVASITQRSASVFEIDSSLSPDGLCTLGAAGVNRAQFCTFLP